MQLNKPKHLFYCSIYVILLHTLTLYIVTGQMTRVHTYHKREIVSNHQFMGRHHTKSVLSLCITAVR